MTEQQERAYHHCFVGCEMHIGRALNLAPHDQRGWHRWLRWHPGHDLRWWPR